MQKWRAKNPERDRENQRRWIKENPELNAAKGKRYRNKHAEKYKQQHNLYLAKKRKEPGFAILNTLRSRLSLLTSAGGKSESTLSILGCSIEEFRSWLSGWFEPGMSWENYGKVWHIDHRRPCASFDMTRPEEQKRCFSFLNLQPLFVTDNLRKGAKYG